MRTSDLIENFAQFAREQVHLRGEGLPLDALFDEWRNHHPPSEDWTAIRASVNDMETGETGRTFDSFVSEFNQRNNIRECG
jgi:hypothetical protein